MVTCIERYRKYCCFDQDSSEGVPGAATGLGEN
jgi:hypothetical protein